MFFNHSTQGLQNKGDSQLLDKIKGDVQRITKLKKNNVVVLGCSFIGFYTFTHTYYCV